MCVSVSYACDIIIIFVEEPWVKIGKPLLLASQFLVQFIKLLCLYSSLQLSRGLLLYGPSGTGKTSLVRAVVQECNAHLIVLSPYSVHRVHAGENEKVLREAFAEASSVSDNKPSVIFIDEIDVLCPREESKILVLLRSSLHSWTRTSLHHLHQELLL